MAIVKMKHLRLFAMSADREELLRQLQHIGCVEISESADQFSDPEWASLLTRSDSRALAEKKETFALLSSALVTLNKYAPVKTGLLTPRREVSEEQLFDDEAFARTLDASAAINDEERRISSIYAEQSKLKTQILSLAPWLDLNVPLDAESTRNVSLAFGTIAADAPMETVKSELYAATQLAEIIPAGKDRDLQYFLFVCHKSAEEEGMEVLKKFGFSRAAFRGWKGTAAENTERIESELAGLDKKLEDAKSAVTSYGERRDDLKLCIDRLKQEVSREEAKTRLLSTKETFYLDGWVSVPDLRKLESVLVKFVCAWETAEPEEEEYPQVPIKLKNNAITRPLNMVTEMYSLPAYNGVDPNPLIAPFFILFYGIMMSDMGYGLIMMILAAVVLKKARPKGGMYHFFALMGLCGISSFIMGIITGGFLGDFLPQIAKIINPDTTFSLPSLFTPLGDTLSILVGAMCLGAVQIVTGMAISFIMKLRDGQVMDAVWEELTWWIVFVGLALAILNVTKVVLIVGGVMVVVGSGWNAKGFGKVTAVIGSLYNHVTGYFGDILSYSRLMALMLAGSVIAQVFNTLGAIPGNIFFFLIVSLAGNALNFALNLLSCYVHDLRLQCLEYFGKFYKDGGRPFAPLSINTKYVDVTE